jgi:deferrochelatase/peroxidase EfeB
MIERKTVAADLDLADIQGNILTAYGRLGFPKGRFLLLNVRKGAAGRAFVEQWRRRVTTALRWPSSKPDRPTGNVVVPRPEVAINMAFTFRGLLALELPTRTLRGLPDDYIDGMRARAAIVGDSSNGNSLESWDPVWTVPGTPDYPHILITLNAQMQADGSPVPALDTITAEIIAWCDASQGGVALCKGHRGADPRWQDLTAIMEPTPDGRIMPTPREHFGFTDAISDPAFQGQVPHDEEEKRAIGQGKTDGAGTWSPIATGEFLLGWPDEAQEIPGAAMPLDFSRNGTFFAYRKLHEDVGAFDSWLETTAQGLAAAWGITDPDEARETLKAKLAGRWSDGVPLMAAPTFAAWDAFNRDYPDPKDGSTNVERYRRLVSFGYREDPQGLKCPIGAHARRMSTRDMLDPHASDPNPKHRAGSALNNRRRILRRGLPYGGADDAHGEHGIVMFAVCASLARQFEFVQQQWLNYGLDFGLGNDTCPLVGNHAPDARFVIAADPTTGNPPFIASAIPQFVSTRGGDYFFMPSMTALRMIGMGVVDPT